MKQIQPILMKERLLYRFNFKQINSMKEQVLYRFNFKQINSMKERLLYRSNLSEIKLIFIIYIFLLYQL